MKLAISNIAWPVGCDKEVADLLLRHNVTAIEIAPTKIWSSPLETPLAQIRAYRESWAERGIRIVAAQALLFGRPELTIFDDAHTRRRTLEYLHGIINVGAELGAEALVFGSPKNRRVGSDLHSAEAWRIAVEFFRALGGIAADAGTAVVLEANPKEYGANFVTNAHEALALVRDVNQTGFRLHLDAACMTLSGDAVEPVIEEARPFIHHFHISEPFLAPVGSGRVSHQIFADALRAVNYDRYVSIEMKQPEPFRLDDIKDALCESQCYCPRPLDAVRP